MSAITITPISSKLAHDAVEIMAQAFYNESFTSYIYDLSTPKAKERFKKGFYLRLKVYIETEQIALAAIKKKRVLGALAMQNTQNSPGFMRTARLIFPEVFSLFPLLTKIRLKRLLEAGKALKNIQDLPKPHHLIDAIGVSPKAQGQGIGRMLLDRAHEICDRDSLSKGAYLYTADRKNVEIYQHVGYEIIAQRACQSLEIFHMFRPSKTSSMKDIHTDR